jgi:hypothetical protein
MMTQGSLRDALRGVSALQAVSSLWFCFPVPGVCECQRGGGPLSLLRLPVPWVHCMSYHSQACPNLARVLGARGSPMGGVTLQVCRRVWPGVCVWVGGWGVRREGGEREAWEGGEGDREIREREGWGVGVGNG